ncbi:hypothetical protein [Neptuniibacter marinus]|uniref:hypothetical protein n=1 Tax=Neptuniibacter marinus TaxID=1806670 RepID=UPI003B5ACDD0
MRKNQQIILTVVVALLLGGCVTTREAQIETALKLDKEHFKKTLSLKDDSLDTVATFSTVNGFKEKHGLLGI